MSVYKDRPIEKKRRDIIMKKGFTVVIMSSRKDNSIYTEAKCPECSSKICYFSKGDGRYHTCTICKENVYL